MENARRVLVIKNIELLIGGEIAPAFVFKAAQAQREVLTPSERFVLETILSELEDHGFEGKSHPDASDVKLLYLGWALCREDRPERAIQLKEMIERALADPKRDRSLSDVLVPEPILLRYWRGLLNVVLHGKGSVPQNLHFANMTPLESEIKELLVQLHPPLRLDFLPPNIGSDARRQLIEAYDEVVRRLDSQRSGTESPSLPGGDTSR